MVGWHHQFKGHEFEQALGVGDGQAWCAAVHRVTQGVWNIPSDLNVNHRVEADGWGKSSDFSSYLIIFPWTPSHPLCCTPLK